MAETAETPRFEQWAIVEIMGHVTFAGLVSEETLFGKAFVRIDVPEVEVEWDKSKIPAFTKWFGPDSIYSISPCSEDVARTAAMHYRKRPITVIDFSRPMHHQPALTADMDDDDFEE